MALSEAEIEYATGVLQSKATRSEFHRVECKTVKSSTAAKGSACMCKFTRTCDGERRGVCALVLRGHQADKLR
eukprot:COSAG05_NODE_195_length_14550_cov_203.233686_15_plen_73_part_00